MTLTVEQMCDQVKEIDGKIAKHFFEKGAITFYIFIAGYPDVFEFFVNDPIPIAEVELKPSFRVEELERVIAIKREIIRLTKLLSDGYLSNKDCIKDTST